MRPESKLMPVFCIAAMIHGTQSNAQTADLDEIPAGILAASVTPASEPTRNVASRRFIEAAFTLPSYRDDLLVPLPAPSYQPHWRSRVDIDLQDNFKLSPSLSLTYGNRFNIQYAQGNPWATSKILRNDLRELYATQSQAESSLDFGRINIRSGVASGYNPTDYFRARSIVERVSQDPSVLRENRLGTVALRIQNIFPSGAIEAVFAPKLQNATPVDLVGESGLSAQLGRTNASNRLLIKGNHKFAPDFDPEASVFIDQQDVLLGLSLTRALTERLTVYGEWSGGRQKNLAAQAYQAGVTEQRYPANFRPAFLYSDEKFFRNDLALGITVPMNSNLDATLEYGYHQGGFSSKDWGHWFSVGRTDSTNQAVLGQLNYLRAYTLDQQKPMNRHNLFSRIEWRNSFSRNMTITQLNILNLNDKSFLEQLTVRWDVSPVLSLSAMVMLGIGGKQSENGSNAVGKSFLFNVIHYF